MCIFIYREMKWSVTPVEGKLLNYSKWWGGFPPHTPLNVLWKMFVTYLFQFSLQLIIKVGFTILKGIANRIHTIQLSVVMLVPSTREIKLSILEYNFQLQGLSTNSLFLLNTQYNRDLKLPSRNYRNHYLNKQE